jgi:hypothetical protein
MNADWQYLLASCLVGIAIIYRYWQQPNNLAVYGVAWTLEIIVARTIAIDRSLSFAIANIGLGLLSLLITNWLPTFRSRLSGLISLDIIPLLYACAAIFGRLNFFTAWTGLITLGTAIIGICVGDRRQEWKPITFIAVAAISVGVYELVIYQMLLSKGGSAADGFTILALVTAAIALIYRIFGWFWAKREDSKFFNLTTTEIVLIAHLHWAIASLLKIRAAAIALDTSANLTPISITISLLLGAYAIMQARDINSKSDWWVYVGLVEIAATAVYARLIWTQLSIIDPFRAIIVCIVALAIYQMPWQSLGWRSTPWHRFALAMPAVTALLTASTVSYFSLLVVAVFYARIAIGQRNLRWSYVSLWFIDWGLTKFLVEYNFTDIIWYVLIIGLSLLYIAQFDPVLMTANQRKNRHYLRVFASGIICLTALLFHQDTGLIPSLISLVTIFAGLGVRIRAFLFVGTITFVLTVFYQLVILVFNYSFLKWVIGLFAGIILISIAANFERRKVQIMTVLQNWFEQLREWQ